MNTQEMAEHILNVMGVDRNQTIKISNKTCLEYLTEKLHSAKEEGYYHGKMEATANRQAADILNALK